MILAPLFVLVLMTFALGIFLAVLRGRAAAAAARSGPNDVALRQPNWPPRALQVGYSFQNQFELPVLFYVLTILAIITKHADFLFVVMAWIFVLSRLAHAYVHSPATTFAPAVRFFGIGALVLAIMWLIFIVRIMLGLSIMTPGARLAAAIEVLVRHRRAAQARRRHA